MYIFPDKVQNGQNINQLIREYQVQRKHLQEAKHKDDLNHE